MVIFEGAEMRVAGTTEKAFGDRSGDCGLDYSGHSRGGKPRHGVRNHRQWFHRAGHSPVE
jgi:hypothetical protein